MLEIASCRPPPPPQEIWNKAPSGLRVSFISPASTRVIFFLLLFFCPQILISLGSGQDLGRLVHWRFRELGWLVSTQTLRSLWALRRSVPGALGIFFFKETQSIWFCSSLVWTSLKNTNNCIQYPMISGKEYFILKNVCICIMESVRYRRNEHSPVNQLYFN